MIEPGTFYTDRHLGGYVAGGDPDTQYPDLWAWLVDALGVRSVVDVGCGDGQAVKFFGDLGCEAVGIDGVPQDDPRILLHDYTEGPLVTKRGNERYDLCWSCEFVEHVEAVCAPNFLATFRCADLLLMTHASPGQPGWHHVNCQPPEYWIAMLTGAGFEHDPDLTARTRELAALNPSPWNHYVRSGLAFRRRIVEL
jgi:hypothetical protein